MQTIIKQPTTYCTTCGGLGVLYNMETDEQEPCFECDGNDD